MLTICPPIKFKAELIQVRLKLNIRKMMKNPQEQALCVANGSVHPWECIAGFLGGGFWAQVSCDMRSHGLVGRVSGCHQDRIGLKQRKPPVTPVSGGLQFTGVYTTKFQTT